MKTNRKLRQAIISIIKDTKSLSKKELQDKFNSFNDGPVGYAVLCSIDKKEIKQ